MNYVSKSMMVCFCFCLFFMFSGHPVFADRIILENGDSLTGVIEKLTDDKITLKTDYSTPIVIDISKVRQIFTDRPAEIHLKTGDILTGKIVTQADGLLSVEDEQAEEKTAFSFDTLAKINPPDIKRWRGNINLGGSLESGNTDRLGLHFAADAVYRTLKNRLTAGYMTNYAREDKRMTTRNHYVEVKGDHFYSERVYGYLGVELLNDTFKDLSLRSTVGPGVGYQFWDEEIKSLSFEAGPSYIYENRRRSSDDSWMVGRIGSQFRYRIFDFLTFSDRVLFYPSLERGGEFVLRNEAALVVPVNARLSMRLSNILEHDSDPQPGVKKNDVYWIYSLQYSF